MKENEHFWLGVTLSNDPAPDNLFVVASYAIDPDGKIGSTASQVIDPAVREDLADALRAIADGSEAPTAPHGWLTLEGFDDEPGSNVDFAFDTVSYGTVINVEHANAGEDVHAAIRSACEGVNLAEVCIVSDCVWAQPEEGAEVGTGVNYPNLTIGVSEAKGTKCPRCWMHSQQANAEGLCPRCAAVVAKMDVEF